MASTFFKHWDLPSTHSKNLNSSASSSPSSGASSQEPTAKGCQAWNYKDSCSCDSTASNYASHHLCREGKSSEHPMLHCPKRKMLIPIQQWLDSQNIGLTHWHLEVFQKSPFWGLESAEIASNQPNRPSKLRARPCISLEAGLMTFLLMHVQKSKSGDSFWAINHPTTLGLWFFNHFFFFFCFSLFSSSYLFAAVVDLLPAFFWVQEFQRKR